MEASIRAEACAGHLALRYVHAPAGNVALARNACLDAATAEPDWLRQLLQTADTTGADVVFGPVVAIYPPGAPAWLRVADLHSTRPTIRGGRFRGGYASNCLLRRAALGTARFDAAFGRSGGEDTAFFNHLLREGARSAFSAEAIAHEPVPAERAALGWLLRRWFRYGQTLGRMREAEGTSRAVPAMVAAMAGAQLLARLLDAARRSQLAAGDRCDGDAGP